MTKMSTEVHLFCKENAGGKHHSFPQAHTAYRFFLLLFVSHKQAEATLARYAVFEQVAL